MLTLSMLATASVLACGPRVDPPPAGAGLSTAHLPLGNVPRTGRTTRVGSSRLPGGLSGVAAAVDLEGERLFYVPDNGALVTVDLTTGTALKTNQVAPSQLVLALMFDGASQELVGIGDPFEGRDQLVRINPGTGASVFVGPGRLPFGLWSAAAAFDAEHSLFFYIAADRNLYGVDARTGTIV